MVEATCHCGAVKLRVTKAPDSVKDCNCSICHRYGTLWAYYALDQVKIAGATDIYMWGDKSLGFHRCRTCGCVTHWWPVDEARNRMGLNANLMPRDVLEQAAVIRFDGASM
jgi:hypothetical protein